MTATYKTVPTQPTEEQWGGLARDIVMWTRMHCGRPTGALLHDHLRRLGRQIPAWLVEEISDDDNIPAKGTVAACIYKAMVEAAPQIVTEAEKRAGDAIADYDSKNWIERQVSPHSDLSFMVEIIRALRKERGA